MKPILELRNISRYNPNALGVIGLIKNNTLLNQSGVNYQIHRFEHTNTINNKFNQHEYKCEYQNLYNKEFDLKVKKIIQEELEQLKELKTFNIFIDDYLENKKKKILYTKTKIDNTNKENNNEIIKINIFDYIVIGISIYGIVYFLLFVRFCYYYYS